MVSLQLIYELCFQAVKLVSNHDNGNFDWLFFAQQIVILWDNQILYRLVTTKDLHSSVLCYRAIISLMECVSMCHSILKRRSYLIEDWYYQSESKASWQIKQKAIILHIPTKRKLFVL